MFVRVRRAVPDDEVRSLRIDLCDAFGSDSFWIFRQPGLDGAAPIDHAEYDGNMRHRHLLERVPYFYQDGVDIHPDSGETFLRVYPASRYYGIGYERGDLPLLLSIARFLRDKTGGAVWYGGDSSGICADELTPAYEAQLWTHFLAHQHAPYLTPWGGEGITPPVCEFCGGLPMRPYGSGQNGQWAPFICRGCGWDIETSDGGATWTTRKARD